MCVYFCIFLMFWDNDMAYNLCRHRRSWGAQWQEVPLWAEADERGIIISRGGYDACNHILDNKANTPLL